MSPFPARERPRRRARQLHEVSLDIILHYYSYTTTTTTLLPGLYLDYYYYTTTAHYILTVPLPGWMPRADGDGDVWEARSGDANWESAAAAAS